MATFESALPASAVLTLTKGATDTGVKAVIDETRKTATFTAASKYAVGTYTVTATAGTSKQSKDIVIETQKAKDIVIKSTTALVNPDKKDQVFVYYDVIDQYGESMRASTTVTWTSGTGKVKANKTTGCITIERTDDDEFKYGDDVYLVGVDIKNGITVQKALKVGMERALDKIDFVGFINIDDRNNILKTLPKDFAVGRYRLLFTAYDQEGNPMNASTEYTDVKKPKVTFIGDNPTLIKPEFKSGELYTINGIEYCSVTVDPGMYVDKGGEVNITAISNTTGTKTVQNFVVGDAARLQSLVLSVPDRVIADGDQNVNIPFVAKDINGKEVTNYETIVRSTNTLKLTATEGTLTVYETETGAAAIKWNDNKKLQTDFTTSSCHDDVNRNIALVTVVVGGESNNMMMEVSDTRRPVAISKVRINKNGNNMMTESSTNDIDFFSEYGSYDIQYMDQYNEELEGDIANAFFEATNGEDKIVDGKKVEVFDGHEYGVKVDFSTVQNIDKNAIKSIYDNYKVKFYDDDGNLVKEADKMIEGDSKSEILNKKYIIKDSSDNNAKAIGIVIQNRKDRYRWWHKDDETKLTATLPVNSKETGSVVVDNLKYSVVRLDEDKDKTTEWSIVDAEKNIDYTIVPVAKLSNLEIKPVKKVKITTKYSGYANGTDIGTSGVSSSAIAKTDDGEMPKAGKSEIEWNVDGDKDRVVEVVGTYDGNVVTVPSVFLHNELPEGEKHFDKDDGNPTFKLDYTHWRGVVIDGLRGEDEFSESDKEDINKYDPIRYSDLYDFNTAKNIRKDARKNLFINVYDKAEASKRSKDKLATLKTKVSVSDEKRFPVNIALIENYGVANKLNLSADNTELIFDQKIKKLSCSPGESKELGILVTDQYGDGMIIENPNDKNICDLPLKKDPNNDGEYLYGEEVLADKNELYKNADKVTVEYAVSNIVENKDEFAHLSKSFLTNRNGSELASIAGAEVKDTFDLTITVVETGVNIKVPVVIGGDKCAQLSSGSFGDEIAYKWIWRSNSTSEGSKIGYNREIVSVKDEKGNTRDTTLRDTLGYNR
ncbi:MAG: hypothetical protein K1W06_10275 [Lachnospiraceae bacterium]